MRVSNPAEGERGSDLKLTPGAEVSHVAVELVLVRFRLGHGPTVGGLQAKDEGQDHQQQRRVDEPPPLVERVAHPARPGPAERPVQALGLPLFLDLHQGFDLGTGAVIAVVEPDVVVLVRRSGRHYE